MKRKVDLRTKFLSFVVLKYGSECCLLTTAFVQLRSHAISTTVVLTCLYLNNVMF